jgi:hypothetical protein
MSDICGVVRNIRAHPISSSLFTHKTCMAISRN